jgi:hypothetical protein
MLPFYRFAGTGGNLRRLQLPGAAAALQFPIARRLHKNRIEAPDQILI